jgi:glycosyltransferase involved in cell wall biosynthesis
MTKLAVIIPVFNEEKLLPRCLQSLLRQTLNPSQIIICDNQSTDNSVKIAQGILEKSGFRYKIVSEPRRSSIDKGNIGFVYHRAGECLDRDLDFVACLEADVVLDKKYYETIVEVFSDPKVGLASGILLPFGFQKSFPLPESCKLTWGPNRVYRYSCWMDLTNAVDLRLLPAWDTDHDILALIRGWRVMHTKKSVSWHDRPISSFKGIARGIKYKAIGYPYWWVFYRAIKSFDPGLLVGYVCKTFWGDNSSPLRAIYQQAIVHELQKKAAHELYI